MKESLKKFIRQKVLQPILTQLKQGISPSKLALSVALGVTFSVFPIFGTTTYLCMLSGVILKLNQPTLIAVNYLMTPIQLIAIPVLIRIGEKILKLPAVSFNLKTMFQDFFHSPMTFMNVYGKSALAAIIVWSVIAIPLTVFVYNVCLPVFKRVIKKRAP